QAVDAAGGLVEEEASHVHDGRVLWRVQRDLDDLDQVARGGLVEGRVGLGRVGAAGELAGGADAGGPGDVDVDVLVVVGVLDHRVGVRTAAGLDGGDVLRVVDVADVEDPHAAEHRLGGVGRAV